jgi:hypothetical protein
MFSLGHFIQRGEFLRRQAHSHHLHGLGPAPRTTTPATLQLLDVVPSFGLIRPPLELLVAHHANIV